MATDTPNEEHLREVKPALLRGWKQKCPSCGQAPIFSSFLKVRDECPVCHEQLSHHRADDGPAYLTILIVGHIIGPLLLWSFVNFEPDPLMIAIIFTIGSVALSLYLLPRLKGAVVAMQWAKRMHGFSGRSASPL
ncbi:DUF983 domain-containing protein [uncultured Litoreibacter sp.]|uniref:DUF983 domain-containing protein n=1 Tax=uncultured Litoreibacter sp. TaxID=1392394 RepID=UPI002631D1D5|nr:DUF983 domain-containing protein [uncultured Litoreibacter sp.]